MSQDNHEARIAELEKAVRSLMVAYQTDQKVIFGLIKSAHTQGKTMESIGTFLLRLNPELATPEIKGLLHKAITEGEFTRESIDDLEKLISGGTIPPSTEPPISPA